MNKLFIKIGLIVSIITSSILGNGLGLSYASNSERSLVISAGVYDKPPIVNSDEMKPVHIASTTKLMTYLVIKDLVSSGKGSMEDPVTFSKKAAETDGSKLGLKEGEIAKAGTLLESVLIISANDSCIALAEHFAGNDKAFVKMMNDKAKELKLQSAIFYTPNGLEDENGNENTMTAHDLYTLSSHILKKYPEILEITSKQNLVIPEYNVNSPNTNNLLKTVPGVDGLKTGFTDTAGRCLIATGKKDPNSPRVLSVVMGADSEEQRDNMSADIMNTLMNEYSLITIFPKDKILGSGSLNNSKYLNLDLVPMEDISIFMRNDEQINTKIDMVQGLSFPINKGDVVGKLSISHGNITETYDLTVLEKFSVFKALKMMITNFFKK